MLPESASSLLIRLLLTGMKRVDFHNFFYFSWKGIGVVQDESDKVAIPKISKGILCIR